MQAICGQTLSLTSIVFLEGPTAALGLLLGILVTGVCGAVGGHSRLPVSSVSAQPCSLLNGCYPGVPAVEQLQSPTLLEPAGSVPAH